MSEPNMNNQKATNTNNKIKNKSLEDFIKQNQVGSGSFSKVYKVFDKTNNTIYAAKILNDEIEYDSENLNISQEINILSKLNHPTILKFMYFSPFNFKHKPRPVIITEFTSNGTLKDFIEAERLGHPKMDGMIHVSLSLHTEFLQQCHIYIRMILFTVI